MTLLKVENGKIVNKQRNKKGNFNCSFNRLTTLENCPNKVDGWFDCSHNCLTSLNKSPKEVNDFFDCGYNNLTTLKGCSENVGSWFGCRGNNLTTLKGCPKQVDGMFDCSFNSNLEDISNLPTMVKCIDVESCYAIQVFTTNITNKDGTLIFNNISNKIRSRIKSWSCYDVVNEDSCSITVRIKPDNEIFMNKL